MRLNSDTEGEALITKAKAEAEAERIRALATFDLEIDLERRTAERIKGQEIRKQENMESIVAQAIPLITEGAKTEELEEDWIAHVFKQCDTVSDNEMQSLWAKLLAGEANKAGSYSKRTVNLIADLDKRDAHLFTNLVQFCWMIEGHLTPFIYDYRDEIYSKYGLDFTRLSHLNTLGLLNFETLTSYAKMKLPKYVTCIYFGKPTVIEFPKDTDNTLSYGQVMLTQSGKELASICGAQRNEAFYQQTIQRWFEDGYIVQSIRTNSV